MKILASAGSRVWRHSGRKGLPAVALKGQGLAEYGLIVSLIAVACVASLNVLGASFSSQFTWLSGVFESVNTSTSGVSGQSGSGEAAALMCQGNDCDGDNDSGSSWGW